MSKHNSVAVVGAGASGIFCAIFCAKEGVSVDVFEQNSKIAKKILASGNGRCNISNTSLETSDYFSDNFRFVKYALNRFGFEKFESFVNSIGLLLDKKDDGRVYPLSNEAKSVVQVLQDYAVSIGVNFICEHKVKNINNLLDKYSAVVVATGSMAASHLGGNDDGLMFAKEVGHSIIEPYPSLVQFELNSKLLKNLSGV